MDRRPIGVFDSGVGGLTVFKALEAALPGECFVYLGDTARVPYGTKSPETVSRYGIEAARFLKKQGVKLLVVACNTVSSVAMDEVAEEAHVPVIGVILPGARRAAKLSTGGRIGVIGTRATVASEAYPRAILALRSEAEVFSRPCPLFVPLAEEGWTDNDVARRVAETYLASLKEAEVDTVVLGCTHYPLLAGTIGDVMGPGVALVDSADAVAAEVREWLERESDLAAPGGSPRPADRFYVTDSPAPFASVAERFLGRPVSLIGRARVAGE
ncbi:MAG: glutamate racemase [Acidobacteriia bacterium]|nr:glutamate racemase [Terriglobia bacterium]